MYIVVSISPLKDYFTGMMDSTSISTDPIEFSLMDIKSFTDCFSEANFLGRTQFGIIYRGKIQQGPNKVAEMTVKIWESHVDFKHLGFDDRKFRFHVCWFAKWLLLNSETSFLFFYFL